MNARVAHARKILRQDRTGTPADVTAQERADAADAVLVLLDRLESMLEHTTDMITVLADDGTIRYSNRAAGLLTGHSEDINGSDALDLIHPDDADVAATAFDACVATPGKEVTAELRLRHADGSWHTVDAYAKNCLDTPVAGVVVTYRDVTDRKHAEAALIQQETMASLGRMAAAVAHELRNPLGVLTNVVYILRNRRGGDPAVARTLDVADNELEAATTIVSDLLDFARAQDLSPAPVDVAGLLDDLVATTPAPPGVTVTATPPPQPATVLGDHDLLLRALANLLWNAFDAMPSGGSVVVTAEVRDGDVWLSVADTGTGIDHDALPRVFDPFFSTRVKGVGLGLAVVQRVAGAHGGRVTVDSRPGHGAVFTLVLPAVAVPEPRPLRHRSE